LFQKTIIISVAEKPLLLTYRQLSDISKVYAKAIQSNLGPIGKAIVILPKIPVTIVISKA